MKSSRPLRKVSVSISPEAEDAVVELLGRMFSQPAAVYSNAETGEHVVSVYLEAQSEWNRRAEVEVRAALAYVTECGLDVGPAIIKAESIRREDWAESWKKHFKPMEVGRTLLVHPSWSKRRPRKGQHEIVLDPGLSFGTGQHPTTRFCLEQLVACRKPAALQSMLDIGTGSGILAIAAAKLGFQRVDAFDLDPDAVRVAQANAIQNRVWMNPSHSKKQRKPRSTLPQVQIRRQDLTRLSRAPARQYDVICANLIYDLLVDQKSKIISRLRPGGKLILAGILGNQFDRVQGVFERAGLVLRASKTEKEWQSGMFSKGI